MDSVMDAETTNTKKAISGTELKDKLIHQMVGCVTTQGDTNRQEKWANRNLWEFSTGKCQVLQQGKNNPMHQYIENKDFLR